MVRGEKASPAFKKVDIGVLAALEGWWRLHFWLLSMACAEDSGSWPQLCTPASLLGARLRAPASQ